MDHKLLTNNQQLSQGTLGAGIYTYFLLYFISDKKLNKDLNILIIHI